MEGKNIRNDANQLSVLHYKGEPHKIREIQLLDFRNLLRQQEIITNMLVEAKQKKDSLSFG
ncbi:hypothetical protein ACXM0N_13125 [Peribacillus simplex]